MSEPVGIPITPEQLHVAVQRHVREIASWARTMADFTDRYFHAERDIVAVLERIESKCIDELAQLAAHDPRTADWFDSAIERPAGEGEGGE